jgi:hypothetical protein
LLPEAKDFRQQGELGDYPATDDPEEEADHCRFERSLTPR